MRHRELRAEIEGASDEWPDNQRVIILERVVLAMASTWSAEDRKALGIVGAKVAGKSAKYLNQWRPFLLDLIP